MKSLVTGAAGFIGSHLSERLIKDGHNVVGIDCFIDYYPRAIKEKNIESLLTSSNFEFIDKNILDLDLERLLHDVDYIFHQAAQAGVRASWGKDFDIYIKNNIKATQHLLEACKDAKRIKKMVFASSSSVYGDTKDIPMREDSIPIPVSPYGVTKLASEQLCYLYWKSYGIPIVSLRYFTVYGPCQRPDMAFNKFIKAVLKNKPILVYGDGNQTRDFTFISDIVDINIIASQKGCDGKTYNIGGGSRISLLESIKLLGEIAGTNPKIEFMGAQKGDMQHTWSDTSRAVADLGYYPKVDLKTGIRLEFEWLKNHHSNQYQY